MADVNFPMRHPQYLGDFDPNSAEGVEVLRGVDVLIGVGCSLLAEDFFNPAMPSLAGMKIVHIDDDPWEIGKNFPTDCGIQGEVKTVLAELNAALEAAFASKAAGGSGRGGSGASTGSPTSPGRAPPRTPRWRPVGRRAAIRQRCPSPA